ncbi:MAG: oligosaccharide flippase family protein, partial [Bacteroidia bacterium]|nr:oligosaccharide flippase family protein [Bacteroidia bacterium]
MSNPLKKLAGQTAIYGLGTILPRFLNYFLTPVLTYAFAAAEYGINGELFAYISFLNIIFTYGMETTFFNFYTKNKNKQEVYNTALLMLLGSSAILGLILILLAPSIAENLSTPSVTYLPQFITWCALIIVSDAIMAIPFAKLRSDNQPLKFSILKIANVLINAGLTVFFVMICKPAFENGETTFFATLYNPEIGIGYCFLSMLIANVVTLLFIGKQFAELKLKINKELLNQMLKYTWPLIILGLAGMVNETLDRIILKKLM